MRERQTARQRQRQAEVERGRERQRDRQKQRGRATARHRGLFADPFSYIGQRDSSEEIFVKVPVNDVVVKRFSRTIRVHGTVSITGTDACA